MNHCFEICHYQQNVPQHYYLLDTLVYLYLVCPAFNVFAPFVGFAGRCIWFSILFALLLNVCPLFE